MKKKHFHCFKHQRETLFFSFSFCAFSQDFSSLLHIFLTLPFATFHLNFVLSVASKETIWHMVKKKSLQGFISAINFAWNFSSSSQSTETKTGNQLKALFFFHLERVFVTCHRPPCHPQGIPQNIEGFTSLGAGMSCHVTSNRSSL